MRGTPSRSSQAASGGGPIKVPTSVSLGSSKRLAIALASYYSPPKPALAVTTQVEPPQQLTRTRKRPPDTAAATSPGTSQRMPTSIRNSAPHDSTTYDTHTQYICLIRQAFISLLSKRQRCIRQRQTGCRRDSVVFGRANIALFLVPLRQQPAKVVAICRRQQRCRKFFRERLALIPPPSQKQCRHAFFSYFVVHW